MSGGERDVHDQVERLAAIGRLVGSVAHDVIGLTSSIAANLEVLRELVDNLEVSPLHWIDKTELGDAVTDSLTGVGKINDKLRALRAGGRSAPLRDRTVDVAEILRSLCSLVAAEARARGYLDLELAQDRAYVRGDPSRLVHVFLGPLLASVDALEDAAKTSQRVRVWSRIADDQFLVTIEHSGRTIEDRSLELAAAEVRACGGALRITRNSDRDPAICIELPVLRG